MKRVAPLFNYRDGALLALARFEEKTGIRVKEIEYQSSQPWLFPNSLMIGFTAKAKKQQNQDC